MWPAKHTVGEGSRSVVETTVAELLVDSLSDLRHVVLAEQ